MNACDIKSTWRWALTFDPWGLQSYSNHKSPQVGLHVCAPLGTGVIHTLDREPRPCGSFYWHVCPFKPSGIRYTYQYHSQNGLLLVFPLKMSMSNSSCFRCATYARLLYYFPKVDLTSFNETSTGHVHAFIMLFHTQLKSCPLGC